MDRRQILVFLLLELYNLQTILACTMIVLVISKLRRRHVEIGALDNRSFVRRETRLNYLDSIIGNSDGECISELRMDRRTFGLLCELLRTAGNVKNDGLVSVEEQVCMFLHILAHHVKNRTIRGRFFRSGETISRYFHDVLQGVLRLQGNLWRVPDPVLDDCTDSRWRCFKNCLGALDGTYIRVRVSAIDTPRYRTRKGEVATNVLAVCSRDLQFIFVLPGWEGSASDSRVLRDAVTRMNGLRVPTGYYYLVDGGYTNGEGFLAPYRGRRYHLKEWGEGNSLPRDHEEFFNMKHSKARNVIERCFGLLKGRWAILRSPSFYPIRTQCRVITACCLLHNLIRREMSIDPMEQEIGELGDAQDVDEEEEEEEELIGTVEASDQWTAWRNGLATKMHEEWKQRRIPRGLYVPPNVVP